MPYRPIALLTKANVLALHLCGEPKVKIAKELKLSPTTVASIIKDSGIDEIASKTYERARLLTPKALDVVEKKLDEGSLTAALEILRGTNVLRPNQPQVQVNVTQLPASELQRAKQVVLELQKEPPQLVESTEHTDT